MANSRVSSKLLIDTARNKVVFTEADKEFVDFLFNLMKMPIGTVIRLLTKKFMVGCLGNVYGSIKKLNDNYLHTKRTKESLLKPKLPYSACPLLLRNDDAELVNKGLHTCYRSTCKYFTDVLGTRCPCGNLMLKFFDYEFVGAASSTETPEGGDCVKKLVPFMVTDDLVVTPSAAISSVAKLINEVGVQGLEQIEERVVYLGMSQGLMLLKESLQSDTVLSNVFLGQSLSRTEASSSKKRKSCGF